MSRQRNVSADTSITPLPPPSSVIMEISSDSDYSSPSSPPKIDLTTPPSSPSRKRPRTQSPASEGEITDEEGELTPAAEKAQVAAQINIDLRKGGRDVLQKDARYFMMDNVVCSHCGTKGHLSFDCPEELVQIRCFLCGHTGHSSRKCPKETCYICRKPGHRHRDCPMKGKKHIMGKIGGKRNVARPRQPKLDCYVCGESGHLDCSLEVQPVGIMSCCNCGKTGHINASCTQPNVDRVINVVLDMERERKSRRLSFVKSPKKGGKDLKGKPVKKGKGDASSEAESDKTKSKELTTEEYRKVLYEKIRQRRYNR